MNTFIEDKELGRLVVRVNARARRLTFRTKSDAIYVTVPPGTTTAEIEHAIHSLRHKLRSAQQRLPETQLIDLNFRIDADCFTLSLVGGQKEKFLAHSELGKMTIVCPPNTDFDDAQLQHWLRKVIEESLRRNAKAILPSRLSQLSAQHNLPYHSVKINSSKGRWGSCSAKKAINLSYFLLLLPNHLIDYVLLHELCHTREMNHSRRFWNLLDAMTQHQALALRAQLKDYNTGI